MTDFGLAVVGRRDTSDEIALEPELQIVDAHHHLWDRRAGPPVVGTAAAHRFDRITRRYPRYLLDELLADVRGGHDVRATVFVECRSMHRLDVAVPLRFVNETEFVNGVAAMTASRTYGDIRACAAIVGKADLTLGDAVIATLEAHIAASSRFRGIRHSAPHDPDPSVLGRMNGVPGVYLSDAFRSGFRHLARHGLSFDA